MIDNKKDTTKIVSLANIIDSLKKAKLEQNETMVKKLTELFKTEDNIELSVNSEVYLYIKSQNKNKFGLENIMVSYFKAWTENNHEMKNKLKSYLFEYISNKKDGVDSNYLIDLIEDDIKLNKYIKETGTIDDYETYLENQPKKQKFESKEINQVKENVYTFNNPKGSSIAS